MDYQYEEMPRQRQYEKVIGREEIYIPREPKPEMPKPTQETHYEKKPTFDYKFMYAQLIRVYKDIDTGQLYIEANTLFKLRGGVGYEERLSQYSTGLVPITAELLDKLIREYEKRYEVHVDIQLIPIDLTNEKTFNNLDDFIKNNNNIDYKNDYVNSLRNENLDKMFKKDIYNNIDKKDHNL